MSTIAAQACSHSSSYNFNINKRNKVS